MKCPACSHDEDKVLESRTAREGLAIRRRRECLKCNHRFTTYEEVLRDELMVVKRDGSTQEFSRQKLIDGVLRACRKRPISVEQVESLIDAVIENIEKNYEREVPSQKIGEWVMTGLQVLDPVAFIRFASVYRKYSDVQQFLSEIQQMEQRK